MGRMRAAHLRAHTTWRALPAADRAERNMSSVSEEKPAMYGGGLDVSSLAPVNGERGASWRGCLLSSQLGNFRSWVGLPMLHPLPQSRGKRTQANDTTQRVGAYRIALRHTTQHQVAALLC